MCTGISFDGMKRGSAKFRWTAPVLVPYLLCSAIFCQVTRSVNDSHQQLDALTSSFIHHASLATHRTQSESSPVDNDVFFQPVVYSLGPALALEMNRLHSRSAFQLHLDGQKERKLPMSTANPGISQQRKLGMLRLNPGSLPAPLSLHWGD